MARINLLPWRAERRKSRQKEFVGMLGLAALAGVLVAFLVYSYYGGRISGQTERNDFLRGEITKVDGQSNRNARKTDPTQPGKHMITVHFESARAIFRPEYLDIQMDLEACTRYRVVAQYEVKTGPDWKPKVYSEPIGECVKKFKKKEEAKKDAPAK